MPGRGLSRRSWCSSFITMVNIRSTASSSHSSHQEWETDGGATSCSRAGRSRLVGDHSAAMAGMATSQLQRSASTVVTLPLVAVTEAMLVAAHQLLNNPPTSHTSPSAVDQWRANIDQLIVTTINTPPQRGQQPPLKQPSVAHSRTPTAAHVPLTVHTPSTACTPSVAHTPGTPGVLIGSVVMSDLRVELNRRQDGKYSCITIEHQRKRCHNIEGRNLEGSSTLSHQCEKCL
jgi:hypothetical protein